MCNPAPCILLDRDGTIIRDTHYLSHPDGVELLPGALRGLHMLHGMGCTLVVLTNQSGVGRGYYGTQDVVRVHERLDSLLREGGVSVAGMFFCPHTPEESCTCRKPGPGLAHAAAARLPGLADSLRDKRAVMVGDKACDVALGHALGIRAVLVGTKARLIDPPPHAIVEDLTVLAHWVRREFGLAQGV